MNNEVYSKPAVQVDCRDPKTVEVSLITKAKLTFSREELLNLLTNMGGEEYWNGFDSIDEIINDFSLYLQNVQGQQTMHIPHTPHTPQIFETLDQYMGELNEVMLKKMQSDDSNEVNWNKVIRHLYQAIYTMKTHTIKEDE